MSISSFNLSHSKSRNTLHTQYTPARSFPSNCAGFRQRHRDDWQALRSTQQLQQPARSSASKSAQTIDCIRTQDRRSKIEHRDETHMEKRVRDGRARSHIVTQSNSMPSMSLSISTTWLDTKKKKTMKRSPNQAPPLSLFSTLLPAWSCKHRRTNCTQSKFWLFWFGGASDAALRAPRLPIDKAQEQIPADPSNNINTHTTSIYSGPGSRYPGL